MEEAEGKHTPSAAARLEPSQIQEEGLTSGRLASTVLPISLWGGEALMSEGGTQVQSSSDTHRAPAFFSENSLTRKSASWWGWKVVGTSRYSPGGSVNRSDTSRVLMYVLLRAFDVW